MSDTKLGRGTLKQSSLEVEEFHKKTLARLEKIQSHLSESPRTTRLQDKVCIITGAGSLKGIGYVKRGIRLWDKSYRYGS